MPIFTEFLKRHSNRCYSPFLFSTPPYEGARHPLRNPSGPVFNMIGRGGLDPPAAGGGENPAEQEVRSILIMFATFPFEGEPPSPTILTFPLLLSLKHTRRPNKEEEGGDQSLRGSREIGSYQKILVDPPLPYRQLTSQNDVRLARRPRGRPYQSRAERGRSPP